MGALQKFKTTKTFKILQNYLFSNLASKIQNENFLGATKIQNKKPFEILQNYLFWNLASKIQNEIRSVYTSQMCLFSIKNSERPKPEPEPKSFWFSSGSVILTKTGMGVSL